jgi:hypothetical protein
LTALDKAIQIDAIKKSLEKPLNSVLTIPKFP